jgi:hypothetical protein
LTLPGLELQPLDLPARGQSLYRLRYLGSRKTESLIYADTNIYVIWSGTLRKASFLRPHKNSWFHACLISVKCQAKWLEIHNLCLTSCYCSTVCVPSAFSSNSRDFNYDLSLHETAFASERDRNGNRTDEN